MSTIHRRSNRFRENGNKNCKNEIRYKTAGRLTTGHPSVIISVLARAHAQTPKRTTWKTQWLHFHIYMAESQFKYN